MNDATVMIIPRDLAGNADQLFERQVVARRRRLAVAVPRRRAIATDAPGGHCLFKKREGGADARIEFGARHGLQLRLRVVNVINVDAVEAEVLKAARQLIVQIARSHAVAAADDLVSRRSALFDDVFDDPRPRVARRLVAEWDEAAFRGDDHFVARRPPGVYQLFERRADDPLATLEAVVDRRIKDVAAQLDGAADGLLVHAVCALVSVAQVGAEPHARGQDGPRSCSRGAIAVRCGCNAQASCAFVCEIAPGV